MYHEDEFLQISGIQHFSFCRRQWGLIHIENAWNDNILTAEGNSIHERAHDESLQELRKGVLAIRGLDVKSYRLGVAGICDVVEFIKTEDGICLNNKEGFWKVHPVEYKRGNTKVNDCDRLQLATQVMCLEEMLCCEIEEGYIFYHESRRREKVIITSELRNLVMKNIEEMHSYMKRGYTPKVKVTNACKRCSLSNICMPEILKASKNVEEYICMHIKEKCHEENA